MGLQGLYLCLPSRIYHIINCSGVVGSAVAKMAKRWLSWLEVGFAVTLYKKGDI